MTRITASQLRLPLPSVGADAHRVFCIGIQGGRHCWTLNTGTEQKKAVPPFSLHYALANDDSNSIGKVRIEVCVRSPHGIQHLWSIQHFSSPGQEPASAAGGLSTSQAENYFNYWRNSCCSRRHWWSQSLLQELLELSKKLACGPMAQLFGVTLLFKHRTLIKVRSAPASHVCTYLGRGWPPLCCTPPSVSASTISSKRHCAENSGCLLQF